MGVFKEVSGATLNYGIGKFLPQVIGFLLIPLYTSYLTPEDYGLVELAAAFGAFAMIFMRLALPGSVARYYYEHQEGPELRNYITTIYWSLIMISIGMGALIYLLSYLFLHNLVPGLPLWPFVGVILITGVLNTNSEIQKRLIQARKQSLYSAKLSIATSLVGITSAVILVTVFHLGALGIILAGLIGAILFFIQAQFYLKQDMGGQFSFKLLLPSFRYSLNILPSHLVTPFGNILSRSLLAGYTSLAVVGHYALAMRFITPLYLISEAFNSAFAPLYFEARKKDDQVGYKKLEDTCNKIWFIALFIFVGSATIIPPLIYLVTPVKYHPAAEIIPLLAATFLPSILIVMYSPEMYYSKKTFWVSIIAVARFLSNLVIAVGLIKYWGYYALIFAKFAEGLIILSLSVYVSQKMFNFKPNVSIIIKSSLIGIAWVILTTLITQNLTNSIFQLFIGLIVVILFGLTLITTGMVNKTTLMSYLKTKRL